MRNAGVNGSAPSTPSHFALEDGEKETTRRAYALQIVSSSGLRTVPLPFGRVLRIGRSQDNDVVIGAASSEHAAIYGGDPPEIEDLHSDDGTRVRGSRIAPGRRVLLVTGSMIQIGDTLLNVRQQGSLPGAPASASPAETPPLPSGANGVSFAPPPPFHAARRTEYLRAELARAERDRIIEAIAHAGNQAAAAKLLGLSRRALIYRLELYQIPRPRKGARER